MADAADERSARAVSVGLVALFGLIAAAAAADVVADLSEGTTARHVALEVVVFAAGAGGMVWQARRLHALRQEARALSAEAASLQTRLTASRAEAEAFRRESASLINGLSAAIDAQLAKWGLSPAEQEIALLLLKGLSHKEIAEVRGVSEATVRQQSRAIYKKSGLGGRADLAAFFLEDLLGPRTPPGP